MNATPHLGKEKEKSKAAAIAHYRMLLLLKVQLFLRAVVFGGTLLIFGTYEHRLIEKPLAYIGVQESYLAALAILLAVSAAAATMDLPIRYLIKRVRKMSSRKST